MNYETAIKATTPEQAKTIFDELVKHYTDNGATKEGAIRIVKEGIGYYAGYFDRETRARVEKFYNCIHPYLGPVSNNLTPEEILKIGIKVGSGRMSALEQPKDE